MNAHLDTLMTVLSSETYNLAPNSSPEISDIQTETTSSIGGEDIEDLVSRENELSNEEEISTQDMMIKAIYHPTGGTLSNCGGR